MSSLLGQSPVYLVDFSCYKPPEEYKVHREELEEVVRAYNSPETCNFMEAVHRKCGLSADSTYLHPCIHPKFCRDKPDTSLTAAQQECSESIFGALDGLLEKAQLVPKDIDILVTTCSIYCPTPSMASMVVNKYKLRTDVQSYNLGGMGCSNGVVSLSLIQDLLKAHPNSNAVFLTTETNAPARYEGKDRHRLVANVIFRMGAAAILFSNKPSMAARAKYRMHHTARVHVGQSDDAYTAIHYGPDAEGLNGVYLGKNVSTEASRALTKAITAAAPHLMSWRQLLEYGYYQAKRRLHQDLPPYQPQFNKAASHFMLHAGGAKILQGLGKALKLNQHDLQPSYDVLYDYGNISSNSTWYTLANIETVRGVKAGDKLLQVGVGSGIKCGVTVWKAVRDVRDVHDVWEHKLDAAEAAALRRERQLKKGLDVSHALQHVASRARALLVLVLLLCLMWWCMQHTAPAAAPAVEL